jgi:hypothetical protein
MEITAQTGKGFFRSEFPEGQVVTIGNLQRHDVYIPEYGGLGTCDPNHRFYWARTDRYDRLVAPYLPRDDRGAHIFCELLCCGGAVFVRSPGMVYTLFRDKPIFGATQLVFGEPLHVHGVALSVSWEARARSTEEIAQDPDLPAHCLYWLAQFFPKIVAQNPILPLLLLENPAEQERFPDRLKAALME